jgi:hypothetical protein
MGFDSLGSLGGGIITLSQNSLNIIIKLLNKYYYEHFKSYS